jgi:hypothetical protein
METPMKIILSFLVRSRKKKNGKVSDNELHNVASDEKIKKDLLKSVLKQKLFESMCNLLDAS